MRLIRYRVAMSLDGYIARADGGYDWIVMDLDIDFSGPMQEFDTFLMGRKTFEAMLRMGGGSPAPGTRNVVCSRTLNPDDYPHAIVAASAESYVAELRRQPGKDIWLFGGGELFRSLLAAGCVDRVEVAVIPVLLGGGVPLLPHGGSGAELRLREHRVYPKTGTVTLNYEVIAPT
jgi:dihydrofolate reductase